MALYSSKREGRNRITSAAAFAAGEAGAAAMAGPVPRSDGAEAQPQESLSEWLKTPIM